MLTDRYSLTAISHSAAVMLGESVYNCERIKGGMTNFNYKIFTARDTYIYRIPGHASNLLINRKDEGNIILAIKDLHLDVETICFNCNTGEKITRFTAHIPCEEAYPHVLKSAGLLKKLHGSGCTFNCRFDILEKLDFFESLMVNNNIDRYNNYNTTRKKLEILIAYLASSADSPLVPCHNDPVPENILHTPTGQSYLIDWEYAGMNDGLWDLAAFSLENDLDSYQEYAFLTCYFGQAPSTFQQERIHIYTIFQDILWALWACIKSFYGSDYTGYGQQRYKRGIRRLENLHFLL